MRISQDANPRRRLSTGFECVDEIVSLDDGTLSVPISAYGASMWAATLPTIFSST